MNNPRRGEERSTGFFFSAWQDWSDLFGECNWYNFTFIRVEYEVSPYTQRHKLNLALLGLCCRITYVWGDEFNREMQAKIKELGLE